MNPPNPSKETVTITTLDLRVQTVLFLFLTIQEQISFACYWISDHFQSSESGKKMGKFSILPVRKQMNKQNKL